MDNDKIGILIPNLQSGGAERVVSLTTKILSKKGYEVYLIVYNKDNIRYNYEGKLIDIKSKAGSNLLSKILKRISRIIKLSYYKRKYKLDTVISFLYSANVVNYFSISKSKKILSCRGYGDYIQNGKKYSKMINGIDSMIVQTERMKLDFINDFNTDESKINVLYNPFDLDEIKDKSKEHIEDEIQEFINNHKTICTVGSFKKDKGYWHLMKSFIKVREEVKDAGLIFIGHRGEMEEEIKKMADLSGFKDDILFLGYRENPFKYIEKCDLYVCSSIYEGFPNALVEAMACGVPVLSTDCKTGPREILSIDYKIKKTTGVRLTDYGALVPNLSDRIDFNLNSIEVEEKILAKGIVRLLSDKNILDNYSKLSEFRSNDFNTEKYIREMLKLFDKL